ncbi:MAG: DUF932 domain-containing protein [Limisphaerales bacterium]
MAQPVQYPVGGAQKASHVIQNPTMHFKAVALEEDTLRHRAPSIFASGPMQGVSPRYTFVPTLRILSGLRELNWVPVDVEEQSIRREARRGFQKHLIRFRRSEQMETLDEWNVELVLVNSHDAGCAYQLHAGIFRRLCSNGLVMSEDSFPALRFRHAGLEPEQVVQASLRLIECMPRVAGLVQQFRTRCLDAGESRDFAEQALRLRFPSPTEPPVEADTLLKARRAEDEGVDVWRTLNRVQENLTRGGVSDHHRDRRGRLRSVRALRGIDSKVTLNQDLWSLAERLVNGEVPAPPASPALPG